MYFSYNSNFKYIDSTIKYKGFDSINYIINLDIISSFILYNDFNFIFLFIDY